MQKSINRYIPSKVITLINKLKYAHPEHLYIICDMLTRITIFRRIEDDNFNGYIDIPVSYFTAIITDPTTYDKAMKYLKVQGKRIKNSLRTIK